MSAADMRYNFDLPLRSNYTTYEIWLNKTSGNFNKVILQLNNYPQTIFAINK